MTATVLNLTYGTSRGAETYGYTIVSLIDTDTQKRYRCMGGGYDMVGTVFAAWLEDVHQAELLEIADRAHSITKVQRETNESGLYGMSSAYYSGGHRAYRVRLDGGCGLSSMERIAKEIGLSVRHLSTPRGRTNGFVVESA